VSQKLPYIPPELLNALNKRFPEQSAQSAGSSHEELMWLGGQRSVIRFLNQAAEDQTRNSLIGDP